MNKHQMQKIVEQNNKVRQDLKEITFHLHITKAINEDEQPEIQVISPGTYEYKGETFSW